MLLLRFHLVSEALSDHLFIISAQSPASSSSRSQHPFQLSVLFCLLVFTNTSPGPRIVPQ